MITGYRTISAWEEAEPEEQPERKRVWDSDGETNYSYYATEDEEAQ